MFVFPARAPRGASSRFLFFLSRTDAQRLPLPGILQPVLHPMAVVDLIETFGFDEQVLTIQQAGEAGLPWLEALILAVGASFGIVRFVLDWLLVSRDVAFEVT